MCVRTNLCDLHVCIYVCMLASLFACMYVCAYMHTCVHIYTHARAAIFLRKYTLSLSLSLTHTHTHIHTNTYTQTHTYKQAHTQIPRTNNRRSWIFQGVYICGLFLEGVSCMRLHMTMRHVTCIDELWVYIYVIYVVFLWRISLACVYT